MSDVSEAISDIPSKARKWTILLLLVIIAAMAPFVWQDISPFHIVERLSAAESRIEVMDTRLTEQDNALQNALEKTQRYMCLQDRTSATLAGMECQRLVGNPIGIHPRGNKI